MSKRKHNRQVTNRNPKVQQAIVDTRTMVDIVIPIYKRWDLLRLVVEAIPDAISVPYNVIIVDNGNPAGEAEQFYNTVSPIKNLIPIRVKDNIGYPAACNLGARRKNSPFLFILTSDVVLKPGSIDNLLKSINTIATPEIGIVGMKLVFPDDSLDLNPDIRPAGKLQHIGLVTNIRGEFIHIFVGWDADHPKVNAMKEVYAVTGAAFMTKKNIWNKARGFNEAYGKGTWEDMDYCLTVRDMGYNVIVNPEAVAVHYTGATAEKANEPFPLQFNRLIFLQKWAGKVNYTEWMHY